MRITTWNVNSIKQRMDNLTAWLSERQPDVVCLQETKCVDDAFPREPLEALVPRGGRVTILVEPPALPIPGTVRDPRRAAIAAASDELERVGVPTERQTLLVAGGLGRRAGRRVIESLVAPNFALRFRGVVAVHDAEDPGLVEVGRHGELPLRVNAALADADAVVTVGAAETVLRLVAWACAHFWLVMKARASWN